jgi:spermidine synthase
MAKNNLILDHLMPDSGFFLRYSEELLRQQTRFQEVRLVRSDTFGLVLFLNGKIQSAQADEFIYHEALVHPAMLSHPTPKSVFIAGGGEGATLREVLRYPTVKKAVMVDLDEVVVQICRKNMPTWHRGAFDDPRTTLFHEDARAFLENDDSCYDVIIGDLSEPVGDGPSYMLFTKEFYELCRSRLNPGGILVTQSGCPSFVYSVSFHSVTMTLESVFPNAAPYLAFIPSFASDWGFTLAGDAPLLPSLDPVELARRIAPVRDQLRYLDEETLRANFTIPRHLKENKERVGRIIRDGEPLIVI